MEQIQITIKDVNQVVKSVVINATNEEGSAATNADVCANPDVRYLFGFDTTVTEETDLCNELDVPDTWRTRILNSVVSDGDELGFCIAFDIDEDAAAAEGINANVPGTVTVDFNGGLQSFPVEIVSGVTTLQEVLASDELVAHGIGNDTLDVSAIVLNQNVTVPRNQYGATIMRNGDNINISTNTTYNKA